MEEAILASGSEMVTVKKNRFRNGNRCYYITSQASSYSFTHPILLVPVIKEAVFAAQLAREALETNWLKLEIHPDPKYLMPDAIETLKATDYKLGFYRFTLHSR
jgi:thiazole synthase